LINRSIDREEEKKKERERSITSRDRAILTTKLAVRATIILRNPDVERKGGKKKERKRENALRECAELHRTEI